MLYIKSFFVLIILALLSFMNVYWAIPKEYYKDYAIEWNWKKMTDLLAEVESLYNIWEKVPTEKFSELNNHFDVLFDYFPQLPEYKIVYGQCESLTSNLAVEYSRNYYLKFDDLCFWKLKNILQEINDNFTVDAKIKVSPSSGSAPLNVSLDWTSSYDPSEDTIPSWNYFWYYKDTNKIDRIIWTWPLVNYTFESPWTYYVHLTVRSANNLSEGVFDWSDTIEIRVWPKSANISVYVNNKKLWKDNVVKVWSDDAKRWVIIDWTWTVPTWSRTIKNHSWSISSNNWFSYSESNSWNPWSLNLTIPEEWEFTVELSIITNDNVEISEEFKFVVSDPIATIRFSPEKWNTSSLYSFDATPSYSLRSRLESYNWEIFDPNWNQIESFEWWKFDRRFKTPWIYTVKLTVVDELWNINDDSVKLYVDSTPPSPQFTIKPTIWWKYPSEFILDWGISYDYDLANWVDSLSYDWSINNANESVVTTKKYDWWKKLMASFKESWEYQVKLIVSDKYNKLSEIEKTIEVESSLKPRIVVSPSSVEWGKPIKLSVDSNKTIAHYHWEFGDWESMDTSKSSISHIYDKAWVYNVKLTVSTSSWEENEVSTNVFVWEKWYPIWIYEVRQLTYTLMKNEICVEKVWDEKIDHSAYSVNRFEEFTIDSSSSVNSKWSKSSLSVRFRPENWNIEKDNSFKYKFDEKWCSYVDFYVQDSISKKSDKKRVRFKVKNALPEVDNLTMSFPQYWNQTWIWINQQQVETQMQDSFNADYDPLIVRINALNSSDPDWHISHYKWYYYKDWDKDNYLEVKITPSTVPYVVFSMQKIPWRYVFWVKLYDNDWWEIDSEEIIWEWPSVFFPPDSENPDIPIVTLSVSPINANIWDLIQFKVDSMVTSERKDFYKNRIIKYDFDWDWDYEKTTKQNVVEYKYEKAWNYRPKVKVIYRWYAWTDFWEKIEILEWLKTWFEYDSYDNKIIVRDTSFWNIESASICMDISKCRNNDLYMVNQEYFDFDYDDYSWKRMYQRIIDKYWNSEVATWYVDIVKEDNEEWINLLSIPNNENNTLSVWNNLDNEVLFYVHSNLSWDCYVDDDISSDHDFDWNPENDKVFSCNVLRLIKYNPISESTIARIYYSENWENKTKDIKINFLDYELFLTDSQIEIYRKISEIIDTFSEDDSSYIKTLLLNLRNSIWDNDEMNSILVQLNMYLEENISQLEWWLVQDVQDIISELSNREVEAAFWWNTYEIAKKSIINILPNEDVKDIVDNEFDNIEQPWVDPEQVKSYLEKILNIANEELSKWTIMEDDFNYIKKNICDILEYYDIQSKACWTLIEVEESNNDTWSSLFWIILKTILWIVWMLLIIFIWLIVLFARQAKKRQNQDEYDDEDSSDQDSSTKNEKEVIEYKKDDEQEKTEETSTK